MTGLKPYRRGHFTYRGLAADTDPIYDGTWQISPVRGSSPSSDKKSTAPKLGQESSKPEQPPLTGIRGKRTPPASPDEKSKPRQIRPPAGAGGTTMTDLEFLNDLPRAGGLDRRAPMIDWDRVSQEDRKRVLAIARLDLDDVIAVVHIPEGAKAVYEARAILFMDYLASGDADEQPTRPKTL